MAKGKLVGFSRFKSKKGNDLCIANIVTDYTPVEISKGAAGAKVEQVFVPKEQYDYLTEKHIGKECECIYTISSGRAFLEELKVY